MRYDALMQRVATALEDGTVSERELERLLQRDIRLTGWGLSLALVPLTASAAAAVGVEHSDAGWVLLAQAAIAGGTGWLLLTGPSREAGAAAIRSALLLAYAAALAGQPD